MLLNSTQGIPSSQVEEESSLLRHKIEEEGWQIDPSIETAIGSAQVLRRPQHEAEGGLTVEHRVITRWPTTGSDQVLEAKPG